MMKKLRKRNHIVLAVAVLMFCLTACGGQEKDTSSQTEKETNRILVPFCTSGSSGIGSSAKELHDYTYSSVTWLDGERFSGSTSKEDIADWIRGLSLGIEVK